MSIIRKIERNKLKFEQKNNKIRKAWRTNQIHKYGLKKYCLLWNKSHKKTNKITPKAAYNV